jgi:hypothetical protein
VVVTIRLALFDPRPATDAASLGRHSPEWSEQRQGQTREQRHGACLEAGDEQVVHEVPGCGTRLTGDEQDHRRSDDRQT